MEQPKEILLEAPVHRSFKIPGAEVIIQSQEDPMPIADLLSIVFAIANSNPDAVVDFCMKIS